MRTLSILGFVAALSACGDDSSGAGGSGGGTSATTGTSTGSSTSASTTGPGSGGGSGSTTSTGVGGGTDVVASCEAYFNAVNATDEALGCGDPDMDPAECQGIGDTACDAELMAYLDCVTAATTVANCRCFEGETAGAGGGGGFGEGGGSGTFLDCDDDCFDQLQDYSDCSDQSGGT